MRTSTELSPEMKEAQAEVIERAQSYGLDFFETIFEVVDYDTMNLLAAYGGFPIRYPHWKWGMEYEKLRKRDVYGMGRIYEMVINNDPCYAYLQESNSIMDQKLVMAHVYAHCDFFKCNAWFGQTQRHMMDEMANHATRIHRYAERHDATAVERFLDVCLSVEHLIDPHSMFMKREQSANGTPRTNGSNGNGQDQDADESASTEDCNGHDFDKLPAKDYMDRYINPPELIQQKKQRQQDQAAQDKHRFPAHPSRDVLLFLLRHAPLDDWQRDILSIIREEAYYFAPQAMTKIMNEGWATYWHSKMMTSHLLKDSEVIDYAEQHSGVVFMPPGGFNPYKIGVEVFKDIERRWDRGQHGGVWEQLEKIGERDAFDDGSMLGRKKIFEVRRIYNDVSFIEEFLTDELIDRLKLYHYRRDPRTGQNVIASRDPEVVRKTLLYRISNMGQPYIYVVDGNYANRGELYLAHQWNGLEVDASYAVEVLRGLYQLWSRPVHLQLLVNEEMSLLTFDGSSDEPKRQTISDELPKPAHSIQ
ncbi:MAG: SpoVR family protein [Planctomycetes bacterium]|nr:SpoVR family protein [Planctomycetota bacterium]NOG55636.1 SpoVR family protein [Planctomycetota bacterium]